MPATDLLEAIKAGNVDEVRNILARYPEARTSPEQPGSATLLALYHGQPEIAEVLAASAEPGIVEAAALGRSDRVADLVSADRSALEALSFDGWTPLHLAAFFGRIGAARALVNAGASLGAISKNPTANTPLHAALAGKGDDEVIRFLVDAGADVNRSAEGGYTPLHLAASRGDRGISELLLQKGADKNALTAAGATAAAIARERGHLELAEYLG